MGKASPKQEPHRRPLHADVRRPLHADEHAHTAEEVSTEAKRAGGKVVHGPDHHVTTYSEKTFPRRKRRINIFNRTSEDGDRNNQILNGSLVRPFRKGNKHKDDYVFVDFEKQNYMNMASSGSNKWKFLNFSSGSK